LVGILVSNNNGEIQQLGLKYSKSKMVSGNKIRESTLVNNNNHRATLYIVLNITKVAGSITESTIVWVGSSKNCCSCGTLVNNNNSGASRVTLLNTNNSNCFVLESDILSVNNNTGAVSLKYNKSKLVKNSKVGGGTLVNNNNNKTTL